MAEMALQRSNETFRRSGSSGMVWEDRFLPDKTKKDESAPAAAAAAPELRHSRSVGSTAVLDRSQSNGGRGFRTGRISPALDPPSPKVSACGFCSIFGKGKPDKKGKPRGRR